MITVRKYNTALLTYGAPVRYVVCIYYPQTTQLIRVVGRDADLACLVNTPAIPGNPNKRMSKHVPSSASHQPAHLSHYLL